MVHAPHTSRALTYAEYALLPSDGRVWELIEGDFYVNAAPVPFHQTVSRRLQYRLMSLLEETRVAWVFDAPIDVILSETTTVQSDLAVVSMQRRAAVTDRGIEAPPDIVVEVLSSNRSHDEVLKRAIYEKFRVPEYWIVDPRGATVLLLRLDGDVYQQRSLYHRTDTLESPSFDGRIRIPLEPVFAPH